LAAMDARSKVDFWQFLRMVFVFFLGGTILSMFALQLSPSYRENALELAQLRQDGRKIRNQFEEKDLALRDVEKKLRIISTEAIKRHTDTEAAIVKKNELKLQLEELQQTQKGTAKTIARMELDKTIAEKQLALHTAELEKLKKENARMQQLMATEKKDCEAKTFDCEVIKSEAESCKIKHREVQNDLERLTLEHEQVKKDSEQMEESCAKLKKQLDDRDESTKKLVHKVEQADLANLLDGDSNNDSSSRINKDDIQSLLSTDTTPDVTPGGDTKAAAVAPVAAAPVAAVSEPDHRSEDGIVAAQLTDALIRDTPRNSTADAALADSTSEFSENPIITEFANVGVPEST